MIKSALRGVALASVFCLLAVSAAFAWEGRTVWTYQTGEAVTSNTFVSGGAVFQGDAGGTYHAINAATGMGAWRYKGDGTVVGSPVAFPGKIVIAMKNGDITALNINNGQEIWKRTPWKQDGSVTLSAGLSGGDGGVFVCAGDGKLHAINAQNGENVWNYNAGIDLISAPLYEDGMVYFGSQKGIFSAIDAVWGKRVWGGGAGGEINTPALKDGFVWFTSGGVDGTVSQVRIKGVIPVWKVKTSQPVTTAPAVSETAVFVGGIDGRVTALSRTNGKILWQFDTKGGTIIPAPVLGEGLVFICGGQGTLFVISQATGKLVWSQDMGGAIYGTPVYANGTLYLGLSTGQVMAMK